MIKLPWKKTKNSDHEEFINPNTQFVSQRKLNPDRPQFKKKRVIPKKILLIVVSLLILLSIFLVVKKNLFTFKKIIFKTADLDCVTNNQLVESAGLKNANYFLFNPNSAVEKLK